MRNCTRLYYYVWRWTIKEDSIIPYNRPIFNKKVAIRLLKRCPYDGFWHRPSQIDCRGAYKGKRVAYCCAYWKNGKIVEQEMPK